MIIAEQRQKVNNTDNEYITNNSICYCGNKRNHSFRIINCSSKNKNINKTKYIYSDLPNVSGENSSRIIQTNNNKTQTDNIKKEITKPFVVKKDNSFKKLRKLNVDNFMIIRKKIGNIGGKERMFKIEHFNVNCNANKNKNIDKSKNKIQEKECVESFNIYGWEKKNNIFDNNSIEKNKELELKINKLTEENKKQSELQNKYTQLNIEKKD